MRIYTRCAARNLAVPALCCCYIVVGSATSAHALTSEWVRQFGTLGHDAAAGVSADGSGNVYVAGETSGTLFEPSSGQLQPFLAKYDSLGNVLWGRQWGSSGEGFDVSTDRLDSVFVTGGGGVGSLQAGNGDAFVTRFDAAGNLIWTGEVGSGEADIAYSVSPDVLGNVYIAGETLGGLQGQNAGNFDVFVSKFNATGELQWTRQLGTPESDKGRGVAADALGNVFISGFTEGALQGTNIGPPFSDAFVARYDANGNLAWLRQFGTTGADEAADISTDGLGNVYVLGTGTGDVGAFLAKYDVAGNLVWMRKTGTERFDSGWDASVDGRGNVYLSGETRSGVLGGLTNAFLIRYDTNGNFIARAEIGSTQNDGSTNVSADALGNVFIAGITFGSLGGPSAGSPDAFVAKFLAPIIPEPSSVVLLGLGSLCACSLSRRSHRGRR